MIPPPHSIHADDDSYEALDDQPYGQNRRRATDIELHRIVEKISGDVTKMNNDVAWFKRIVYACWIALGLVMYYAVIPASNAVHNDIDKNALALARHEDRLMNLEGSRQRRIDRSREDHRNCHMKDLP